MDLLMFQLICLLLLYYSKRTNLWLFVLFLLFYQKTQKIETVMALLFLIPGTPKDLLVYIGGLLPIKPLRFILISSFARFPSVISSTIAGASIVEGNIAVGAISYGVTFFITVMILILINIFDKNKEAKEALEALK